MKPFCNGVSRLRARLCGHRAGIPATHTIPNTGKRALLGLLLLTLSPVASAAAQERRPVYFVDGYHGGIYGHYPVEWKTRFIVDELEAHPEWRIGLEIEPETWDTVALRTPADYARFKRIAADPRVEFTNPTYAQPYCYNISGESIIRQFAYGIRKIRSHFPDVEFVTYSVEEPCFTSSLPQILRLFGFKYASLKCPNTCWGGYTAPYGGELVNWTAPDGTSILTSPRYACEELQPNSVWQTTAWGNETPYIEACIRQDIAHPVGMCYQDAGWRYGPWIGSGDSIRNNSIYVTWREYFERISEGRTTDDYRFPQEDMHVSLMWGSQVMQRIAREVRRAENSLSTAEKMGAIANLSNGYLYKQGDMDEAWRTLMLAQHHDSWIVPYNGLHGKGTWADHIHRWTAATDSICAGIVAAAEGSLAAAGNGRKEFGIRVCNTLGTPRREVVRAALPEGFGAEGAVVRDIRGKKVGSVLTTSDGTKSLLFEAEVPAFGYTTYTVREGRPQKGAQTAPHAATEGRIVVENDMYRLEIDPARGGIVTSLVAKHLGGREYADAGSDYALGELRGHFYEEGRFRSSTETPAEVSVLCDNDLEKRIRIRGAIASHPFTETITLRKGDRKIDFDLRIDWKHNVGIGEFAQKDAFNKNRRAFYDSRYKLNIYFPVVLDAPELYKDAPFDVCKSRLKDTRFSTWDNIKHDILLHWADLAERDGGYGLALLTDHTTSYIYGGGSPLGLTVQYSGGGLWGRDYLIDRPTHIRFAVAAHDGTWDEAGVHEESLRWNEPLLCDAGNTAAGSVSLIDVAGSGYELSAAYPQEGSVIVRLFNASGDETLQTVRFGFPVSKIEEIDLNGRTTGSCDAAVRDGETEVRVAMPRFGLKTFRLTK